MIPIMEPHPITGFIFLILALAIYLLPGIIARMRRHSNTKAITALALFLGWSGLGWVIAFVWALTDNVRPPCPRGDDPDDGERAPNVVQFHPRDVAGYVPERHYDSRKVDIRA